MSFLFVLNFGAVQKHTLRSKRYDSVVNKTKKRCTAHKINLVAKDAIEKIEAVDDLKRKLTKNVRATKISPKAKTALQDCQAKILKKPEVSTRA